MMRKLSRIIFRHSKLCSLILLSILWLLGSHSVLLEDGEDYVENIKNIKHPQFSNPADVNPPSSDFINLGTIIINLQNTDKLDQKLLLSIEKTFNSIFRFSSGTPLHFIIVTDKRSLGCVSNALSNMITKDVATHAVLNQFWDWRRRKGIPPLRFSFVNIDDITNINTEFVAALKNHNIQGNDAAEEKYAADLFYVAPLYHLAFLSMEKMIFIDSTDLVFLSDVKDLEEQFVNMEDEAVMEIGLDLSPHYLTHLNHFIKTNPETIFGLPGRYQGLNTGVVLFNLEKMRKSVEYNNLLTKHSVDNLFRIFEMKVTVGDQDWFTILSYHHPNLITILPCQYNTQLSLQYWTTHRTIFHSYHHCASPPKIFHCNGCGPKPEHCGGQPARVAEYRKYIHLFIQVINIQDFWAYLGDLELIQQSNH